MSQLILLNSQVLFFQSLWGIKPVCCFSVTLVQKVFNIWVAFGFSSLNLEQIRVFFHCNKVALSFLQLKFCAD